MVEVEADINLVTEDEELEEEPLEKAETRSIFTDQDGSYYVNPKRQGNVGMASAIYYFTKNGFNVSIPLTDSQEYDILVEDSEGALYRVQVKTTRYNRRGTGPYEASLMVSGGNRTGIGKKRMISVSKCDIVYILCEDGSQYLLPTKIIYGKKNIALGIEYRRFKVE
jgi:hypothetical protein